LPELDCASAAPAEITVATSAASMLTKIRRKSIRTSILMESPFMYAAAAMGH
jgi:hypothetical protein